jgi:dTDP-3-amino-3,4,6-trideoxy-alpha-D-glucose transaminase
VARRYSAGLADAEGIRLPYTAPWADPVWHLYAVEVDDRDAVRARLGDMGIATGVHYPTPIHLTPAYAGEGLEPGALPNAERLARRICSLPMHPSLTQAEIARVADAVRAFADYRAAAKR